MQLSRSAWAALQALSESNSPCMELQTSLLPSTNQIDLIIVLIKYYPEASKKDHMKGKREK